MFGIGMQELLIILVIALIVLGPKRLPEIARALGKGMREFRKATQEVKESIDLESELKEIEREVIMDEVKTEMPQKPTKKEKSPEKQQKDSPEKHEKEEKNE